MSTDAPPQKRRREESDPPLPITRSPTYWFDDGNIVLQVESTQFRLYRGLLATQSTVFRDIFTLAAPDETLVEGCPVVVVPGDAAEDWKHLLDAIHPKICFERQTSLDEIIAVLRLSQKYDLPAFRAECVRRLKGEFPVDFEDYCKIRAKWTFINTPTDENLSLVGLINMARHVGFFSILPTAFYLLASNHMADPHDIYTHLTSEDTVRFLSGYAQLIRLRAESKTPSQVSVRPVDAGWIPSNACFTPSVCSAKRTAIFIRRATVDISNTRFIFHEWNASKLREDGICKPCIKAARIAYEETQQALWKRLPSFFGLPDWEELVKMDLE
ncbi:BTB domain-containing protein [Mycena kentingensis (nom. inval.)]|nr:BTB domain-containing protein [Mycena kentingensis (nom. inval.)]